MGSLDNGATGFGIVFLLSVSQFLLMAAPKDFLRVLAGLGKEILYPHYYLL